MVKMRVRPAAPEGLVQRQAVWTERWRVRMAAGSDDWATQTAKDTIKAGLKLFAHYKCAYCEARLDWPIGVHIEHYVAKKPKYELAFEWTNLFPSCSGCNTIKGNQDHGGAMIHPHSDDPESILTFKVVTGDIEAIGGATTADEARVKETVRLCGLGRGDLVERRKKEFERMRLWFAASLKLRTVGQTEDADRVLNDLLDPERPFKIVLRTMFVLEGYPQLVIEDRRRFGSHD